MERGELFDRGEPDEDDDDGVDAAAVVDVEEDGVGIDDIDDDCEGSTKAFLNLPTLCAISLSLKVRRRGARVKNSRRGEPEILLAPPPPPLSLVPLIPPLLVLLPVPLAVPPPNTLVKVTTEATSLIGSYPICVIEG